MSSDRKNKYALIHVALGQLNITESEHRQTLCERYAECFKGSSTELTDAHLDDYIEHLKARGFTPKKPRPDRRLKKPERRKPSGRKVEKFVTPDQEAKVAALAALIKWRVRNGLARFTLKLIGRESPATAHEAGIIIEALKGMRNNQMYQESRAGEPFGALMERYGIDDPDEAERIRAYFERKERKAHE